VDDVKAVAWRLINEIQIGRNLAAIDEIVAADFVNHTAGLDEPQGRANIRASHEALFAAFPDLSVTVHDMVSEGEKVVTYKSLRGTHKGWYAGIAPTGRVVEFRAMAILEVRNGQIVSHSAVTDRHGLLRQLTGSE
jgi:steroid delta-isomerase-like uncharacterized protein